MISSREWSELGDRKITAKEVQPWFSTKHDKVWVVDPDDIEKLRKAIGERRRTARETGSNLGSAGRAYILKVAGQEVRYWPRADTNQRLHITTIECYRNTTDQFIEGQVRAIQVDSYLYRTPTPKVWVYHEGDADRLKRQVDGIPEPQIASASDHVRLDAFHNGITTIVGKIDATHGEVKEVRIAVSGIATPPKTKPSKIKSGKPAHRTPPSAEEIQRDQKWYDGWVRAFESSALTRREYAREINVLWKDFERGYKRHKKRLADSNRSRSAVHELKQR